MSLLGGVLATWRRLSERIQDGFANPSGTTRSDRDGWGLAGFSLTPSRPSCPLGSLSPLVIVFLLLFLIVFLYVGTGFLRHCVGHSKPQSSRDQSGKRDCPSQREKTQRHTSLHHLRPPFGHKYSAWKIHSLPPETPKSHVPTSGSRPRVLTSGSGPGEMKRLFTVGLLLIQRRVDSSTGFRPSPLDTVVRKE